MAGQPMVDCIRRSPRDRTRLRGKVAQRLLMACPVERQGESRGWGTLLVLSEWILHHDRQDCRRVHRRRCNSSRHRLFHRLGQIRQHNCQHQIGGPRSDRLALRACNAGVLATAFLRVCPTQAAEGPPRFVGTNTAVMPAGRCSRQGEIPAPGITILPSPAGESGPALPAKKVGDA